MPVFCTTHYQSNSETNSSSWKLNGGSLVKQVHLLLCTQGLTGFVEKLCKYEIFTKKTHFPFTKRIHL